MYEENGTKDKGEFIMLAVHSKAPFVMSLEHQKKYEVQDNKKHSEFLKKMKEIEEQKNEGAGSADNER